jgi:hypothetical protein
MFTAEQYRAKAAEFRALLTKTRSWSPKPQPAPTEVLHLLHSTVVFGRRS